ncbi:MAG TPA: MBL fold metallo-hydrolase [Terriglobales bacterium]|nr:MBL fold metallo-hydrolase [Terriglobales bacterium]
MTVKVLGTRGEIEESAPRHSRHSGLLVDGRLLFDLGEPEFLGTKPERVFLTHLHPDHAFFVRAPAPLGRIIYAPETRAGVPELRLFPGRVRWRGYVIRAVPTDHSLKVKSTAYVVEKGGQRLLYTGDMFWINKAYQPLLGRLDLVVTEASFVRRGGMIRRDRATGAAYGHAGVPNLVELFARFTRHILLVHFGSWFYADTRAALRMLRALGKENGVDVRAGYDGYELDLGDLR